MNITGSGKYSKASSPMRRNVGEKGEIQHQLVFIYPMLFTSSFPIELKSVLRSFLSKTFLREIFTANYLDLVKMTNQITPFDRNQQPIDYKQLGIQLLGLDNNSVSNNNFYYGGNQDKHELQQKIDDNFKLIKQYLKSDPVFKKLSPNFQIVTLENFINVPVITGTAMLDLKEMPLIFLLMLALATNTTLDSDSNVNTLITKIKNTKPENLWQLLKKQKEYTTLQKIKMWVEDNASVRNLSRKLGFKQIKKLPYIKTRKIMQPVDRTYEKVKTKYDAFQDKGFGLEIVNQIQKDIDQVGLFFHLVLNETQLKKRYGLSFDQTFSSASQTRISPYQVQIFKNLEQNFLNLISDPLTIMFRSLSNIILPTMNTRINFHDVFKQEIVDNLSEGIDVLINQIVSNEISASLKDLNLKDSNKFKVFKGMCGDIVKDQQTIMKLTKTFNEIEIKFSIKTTDQNPNNEVSQQVSNYMVTMDKLSSQVESLIKKHYKKLNVLIGDNINLIQTSLQKIVNDTTHQFIYEYAKNTNGDEAIRTVRGVTDNVDNFITKLKENTLYWYNNIINYLFLSSLNIALCELVDVVESEIEVAKHEVTDFPNYTLSLPIEIIYALHAAYKARNIKDLFTDENNTSPDGKREFILTTNYAKGMIKYLTTRLKIPNLIVYDEKKGDIYYKFMNMNEINKTKINTIKTFNDLTVKSIMKL